MGKFWNWAKRKLGIKIEKPAKVIFKKDFYVSLERKLAKQKAGITDIQMLGRKYRMHENPPEIERERIFLTARVTNTLKAVPAIKYPYATAAQLIEELGRGKSIKKALRGILADEETLSCMENTIREAQKKDLQLIGRMKK